MDIGEIVRSIVTYIPIYTLASLGIVIGGRSGIFNISGEGAMLAAASAGYLSAVFSGNWYLGFLIAMGMGALFGFLLAFFHEEMKVNQFIMGIALVIFGTGLSDFIYKLVVGIKFYIPDSPPAPEIRPIPDVPILSAFLNQNVVVYFTYAAVVLSYWIMYKTRIGIELRAVGEDPRAADVVGINVKMVRYMSTIIGSSLIGAAGGYLPLVITGTYTPGISSGRGFIAVGIAIFASWRPERTFLGAILFATIEAIALQMQVSNINVPYQFLLMLPFISLLVVMAIFKGKIEFPASIGKPYSRE